MTSGERNPGIDIVRGVAILAVLLLHFGLTYRFWHIVPALTPVRWGNFGVTMFFVVSGYLIAGNEIRRHGRLGAIRLRPFYRRRAARILPLLLLALAIIVPLGALGVPSFASDAPHPWRSLAGSTATVLTFTHNLFMQRHGYTNYGLDVYWSLSVEEVFYAGFPLLCLLLRRDRLIAGACAAAVVVAPFVRHAGADDETVFLCGNLACFDAIAIGVLAALARSHAPSLRRFRHALVLGGAGVIAATWPGGLETASRVVWSFPAIALGTAAILLGCHGATPRVAAPLRWMGRHSYELYLFHIIVLAAMRDLVPAPALPAALIPAWLALFLASSAIAARGAAQLGARADRRLRTPARIAAPA